MRLKGRALQSEICGRVTEIWMHENERDVLLLQEPKVPPISLETRTGFTWFFEQKWERPVPQRRGPRQHRGCRTPRLTIEDASLYENFPTRGTHGPDSGKSCLGDD